MSTPSQHTPQYLVPDEALASTPRGFSEMPLQDVSDPSHSEAGIIANLDRQKGLARLERAVRKHKKGAPDRYWRLFQGYCDGLRLDEVAEQESVSSNRAASLIASMRQTLKDSRDDSERAAEIMGYIQEYPGATQADLQKKFGYSKRQVRTLCTWLQESQWLFQGNPQEGQMFISRKGQSLLQEKSDASDWDLTTHVII